MVVDASIALKWVLDEPGSVAAAALRGEELLAPSLWLAEAGSALWRGARIGQLSQDQATRFLAELSNAPLASLPVESCVELALQLAIALAHPIYDCVYLAAAIQHQTYVVTADRRFAAIGARPQFAGRVRLLAE